MVIFWSCVVECILMARQADPARKVQKGTAMLSLCKSSGSWRGAELPTANPLNLRDTVYEAPVRKWALSIVSKPGLPWERCSPAAISQPRCGTSPHPPQGLLDATGLRYELRAPLWWWKAAWKLLVKVCATEERLLLQLSSVVSSSLWFWMSNRRVSHEKS